MHTRELVIFGAFEFTPRTFSDDRGTFASPYQSDALFEALGHRMTVAQANHSVSRRGAIRGIHFADVPPGQAKYVYCPRGSLLDVIIDIRVGSPTFGQWDAVRLDDVECKSVYVPEGVGHGFIALQDDTSMNYLCSTPYNPAGEHGINPMSLDLPWPADITPLLSPKDVAAPSLAEAQESGLLPLYSDCLAFYDKLRS